MNTHENRILLNNEKRHWQRIYIFSLHGMRWRSKSYLEEKKKGEEDFSIFFFF